MGRLSGRVAVVTGAGGGIGRAIARLFGDEGAIVAIVDKDEQGVRGTCKEIEENDGVARGFVVDVRDYVQIREAQDELVREFMRLDILVNNAAIGYDGNFLNSHLTDWREVIAVDLEAAYVISKLAAEVMARQESGRIISIASLQALMTTGNASAYNVAKAGLLGLTLGMAVDLASHNIIVNAIAPGFIRSGMSILPDGTDETSTADFQTYYVERRRIPLARVGTPLDVAAAALFLASDDCRYMTGQTLIVDGGLSLTI